jgi:hypothetical protein
VDSNPEHDWPMEQATDVRERRQREEVEPPQTGRPAPHLTALARELGAIEPDQEAWVDQLGAREDTVIPASTTPVQHYSEVIEPRPMADARVMKVAVTPEDRRDLQLAATDAHVGMDTAWVHVRDAVGKRLDGLDEPVRIQYMPNPDRRVVSAYSDDLNETVVRSAVREVTALYRELAQRIREPQPEARPGTVTQHYALPAETVRRVSELLSAAPARWVDGIETLLEFTQKVREERDLARAEAEKLHRHGVEAQRAVERAQPLLTRLLDATGCATYEEAVAYVEDRLAPTETTAGRSVPSSVDLAASLAPGLDEVQDLRASLLRSVLAATDTPLAQLAGEVDRLVRYVLDGRP